MEIKNLKTGNLIRFGGEHFKRLVKLQETTGVRYFTKKDLAGCVSADKKTITKTQQKVKKLGTNAKRKQKGGVLINDDTVRRHRTEECPVCYERWDDETKNLIPFQIDECGHEICTTCATRWFVQQNNNACPLCRVEVNVAVVNEQIVDVFEAIREGNINKVKQYIEQGGDVNAKETRGWQRGATPLHCACAWSSLKIVKYLVEENNADINPKDRDGATPLHWLCDTGGHPQTNINIKIFKYLVDKGSDVHAKTGRGLTPLHYTGGGIEILKILIENDADVNAKANDGWTPLHSACSYESLEIVKCLVNNGADVNSKNNDGETPLHLFAQNHDYAYTIFKYLVDKGADVNAKDKNGETPGDIARQEGHHAIVKDLINKGV